MTRNKTFLTLAVVAMASLFLASSAHAAMVLDPGFELNDGSWTFDAAAGNQANVQAHGSRNGYTNGHTHGGPSTLHQTLTDEITEGYTYTLTVDMGQHFSFSGSIGAFRLFGSTSGFGTALNNTNGTAEMTGIVAPVGPNPGGGTTGNYIHDLSLKYTALASGDPFSGQSIGIALVGTENTQVVWDEVRLDIQATIPEPALTLQVDTGTGVASILGHKTDVVDFNFAMDPTALGEVISGNHSVPMTFLLIEVTQQGTLTNEIIDRWASSGTEPQLYYGEATQPHAAYWDAIFSDTDGQALFDAHTAFYFFEPDAYVCENDMTAIATVGGYPDTSASTTKNSLSVMSSDGSTPDPGVQVDGSTYTYVGPVRGCSDFASTDGVKLFEEAVSQSIAVVDSGT
jgi:hypothetical protein